MTPTRSASDIHVLTLTPFYPSLEDERGGFVAEPLGEFGGLGMKSWVLAVRPWHKGRVAPLPTAPTVSWVRYPAVPGNYGLASAGRLLYLRVRAEVGQLHREQRIDILHAHASLPCGEAARRLGQEFNIPYAVTVHGLDVDLTEQVAGRSGARCAALSRQVYAQAACVICISEQVRQRVLVCLPGLDSTEVVYNGVDPAVFFPADSLAGGDPMLASVGSLIPIKGHDVTLRAMAELRGEFPRLRCRIVGEGSELKMLEALARELGISGSVEFLGRRTRGEVAQVLRESAVFILPSRYEGLGCAYLEAMASGLPTIACHGQGIQEVIQSGENGFLIQEQDVAGAATLIRRLIQTPSWRGAVGTAARRTVVAGYTLRRQAEGLLRVYERCLA